MRVIENQIIRPLSKGGKVQLEVAPDTYKGIGL